MGNSNKTMRILMEKACECFTGHFFTFGICELLLASPHVIEPDVSYPQGFYVGTSGGSKLMETS